MIKAAAGEELGNIEVVEKAIFWVVFTALHFKSVTSGQWTDSKSTWVWEIVSEWFPPYSGSEKSDVQICMDFYCDTKTRFWLDKVRELEKLDEEMDEVTESGGLIDKDLKSGEEMDMHLDNPRIEVAG